MPSPLPPLLPSPTLLQPPGPLEQPPSSGPMHLLFPLPGKVLVTQEMKAGWLGHTAVVKWAQGRLSQNVPSGMHSRGGTVGSVHTEPERCQVGADLQGLPALNPASSALYLGTHSFWQGS